MVAIQFKTIPKSGEHQMRFDMRSTLAQLLVVTVLLVACHPISQSQTQEQTMETPFEFYIGQDGNDLVNKDKVKGNTDKQPAGLNFYDVTWHPKTKDIMFKHGQHSFMIPMAYDVMGTEDASFPNEHIREFVLTFALSVPPYIKHQDARDKLFEFFKMLQSKGWKPYVLRGSARLKGKDTWTHEDFTFELDPNYLPNQQEWMSDKATMPYYFYADGVILSFSIMRDINLMDVSKDGDYYVRLEVKRLQMELQGIAGDSKEFKERAQSVDSLTPEGEAFYKDWHQNLWKHYLPAGLAEAKQRRTEDEAAARKKGYKIDETYQDPPIPEEYLRDPQTRLEYGVKPTAAVGGICPLTGFWRCIHPDLKPTEIYILKGDKMPGQSYAQMGVKNPETIYWEWVKPAPEPQA